MANPTKVIDILSEQTSLDSLECESCRGTGEMSVPHPVTGIEPVECEACLGSGYNQLGLIMQDILKPPPEGYGPVELKAALEDYVSELARQQVIVETQQAIQEAQAAIAETQQVIAQAQSLISQKEVPNRLKMLLDYQLKLKELRRRIS